MRTPIFRILWKWHAKCPAKKHTSYTRQVYYNGIWNFGIFVSGLTSHLVSHKDSLIKQGPLDPEQKSLYTPSSHCCPYQPSVHIQQPVTRSHVSAFWQAHLCIQSGPNCPAGHSSWQRSPVQPSPHWQSPVTASHRASFWHPQSRLQSSPYLPSAHAKIQIK